MDKLLDFNIEQDNTPRLIKVVGVGGGGGNAVNHMYESGDISGVSFLLLNTDRQALQGSSIPDKLILGAEVTEGLGAGNKPTKAQEAALACEDEIREALCDGQTKMVFITAGMGGGTGTGAAPVVGRISREAGLLTVGIVTVPFLFEGEKKIIQALRGVEELRKNVDVILVVNNERLTEIYGEVHLKQAFKIADDTLTKAAKGISDIITQDANINVDFADVRTTLIGGGVAVISTGYGVGENRVKKAIDDALNSPLLNNNNVTDSDRVLMMVRDSSVNPLTTSELSELKYFFSKLTNKYDCIWGYTANSPDLEDGQVALTMLATGFDYKVTKDNISNKLTVESYRDSELGIDRDEQERQDQEDQKLIESVYNNQATVIREAKPLILLLSELDDERVLSILESTPAVRRDHKVINQYRKMNRERASHLHTEHAFQTSKSVSAEHSWGNTPEVIKF